MNTPDWLNDNVNSRRGKAQQPDPKPDTTGAELHNGKWIVDVTVQAQRIFGDIVLSAYQIVSEYDGSFSWHSQRHVFSILNNQENCIDLDYGDTIIIFANGNRVKMHTSEWGSIEREDAA